MAVEKPEVTKIPVGWTHTTIITALHTALTAHSSWTITNSVAGVSFTAQSTGKTWQLNFRTYNTINGHTITMTVAAGGGITNSGAPNGTYQCDERYCNPTTWVSSGALHPHYLADPVTSEILILVWADMVMCLYQNPVTSVPAFLKGFMIGQIFNPFSTDMATAEPYLDGLGLLIGIPGFTTSGYNYMWGSYTKMLDEGHGSRRWRQGSLATNVWFGPGTSTYSETLTSTSTSRSYSTVYPQPIDGKRYPWPIICWGYTYSSQANARRPMGLFNHVAGLNTIQTDDFYAKNMVWTSDNTNWLFVYHAYNGDVANGNATGFFVPFDDTTTP